MLKTRQMNSPPEITEPGISKPEHQTKPNSLHGCTLLEVIEEI